MNENNLDIPNFCKLCNISFAEFGDVLKNDPYIDIGILYKIAEGLKIDYIDLFQN